MLHDTTEPIYRYNTGSINMLKEIKYCLDVDLTDKNFFGNRKSKGSLLPKTTEEQSGDRESSS